MIATSTSKTQVQHCQDVIRADAAHISVGKYTLFSAYTTSSNDTMVCLGIALLYGNEDKANWKTFWKFIKEIHPSVDTSNKTIITDQGKGSLASIIELLPSAHPFLCAFHRRQNIVKKFGGGTRDGSATCSLVYNILMKCNSVALLEFMHTQYEPNMPETHRKYLNSVPAQQQFPASRCAMGDDIFMHGHEASSGIKSMTNEEVRSATAVDILNASLILIRKESDRLKRGRRRPGRMRIISLLGE